MKKVKEEKGSITLFTLMSMLFFVIVLVGLYVNSSYKIQKQEKELQEIQKSYEVENIDDLYNKIAITPDNYTTIKTYQELLEKINDENENYIVLENDITTDQYLTISRTVTIDLNGYTYSVNEQDAENSSIIITGTNTVLTIKDSSKSETGSIVTTNTNKNLISIEDGAKLVLESGAICNDNLSNKDTQIINISEDSEFVMNGGTIIGVIIQEGIFTMTSGNIRGNIFAKIPGNCSFQGGTINGKVRLLNGESLKEVSSESKITIATVNTYLITEDTTNSNGTLEYKIDDEIVEYANVGDKVYLLATPNEGYEVTGYEVYKESDSATIVEVLEDNSFIMPDYAVKIKVIYEEKTQ